METTLSYKKVEFLLKLRELLVEYNTFFSTGSSNTIEIWVIENDVDEDEYTSINLPNQFDDDEIDKLLINYLQKNKTSKKTIIQPTSPVDLV